MFKHADNDAIGKYLKELIDDKFESNRQFCMAYIEADGKTADNSDIQRMANRLSQILNGKKALQTYDLPIFTQLLGVSCEEILSAGEFFAPTTTHLTNYSVALSVDADIWERYINQDDDAVLRADEYCKNLIDYAVEFKNYKLIKYLVDNEYIWFINPDNEEKQYPFGAGTSIKHREEMHHYDLESELISKDKLRTDVIALAVKNNDFDMLAKTKAREIHELYLMYPNNIDYVNEMIQENRNEIFIKALIEADEKMLDYFSEEYTISLQYNKYLGAECERFFMFTLISELADGLIKNNRPYTAKLLERALAHNQKIYDRILRVKRESKFLNTDFEINLLYRLKGNIVSGINLEDTYSFISNYVSIDEKIDGGEFSDVIKNINELRDAIISLCR